MTANVRCAGGGDASAPPYENDGDPCGWKGERFGKVGSAIAVTTNPCPWCGGQVEMIPRRESQ